MKSRSTRSCVTSKVDGLRKPTVGEVVEGAVRSAVRRRIEMVIVLSCARASRVAERVNAKRTRATANADRRDTLNMSFFHAKFSGDDRCACAFAAARVVT